MDEHKIIQIMPAGGWGAQYEDESGRYTEPLVAWALVERTFSNGGTVRAVEGVCAGVPTELCEDWGGFVEYVPLGE